MQGKYDNSIAPDPTAKFRQLREFMAAVFFNQESQQMCLYLLKATWVPSSGSVKWLRSFGVGRRDLHFSPPLLDCKTHRFCHNMNCHNPRESRKDESGVNWSGEAEMGGCQQLSTRTKTETKRSLRKQDQGGEGQSVVAKR